MWSEVSHHKAQQDVISQQSKALILFKSTSNKTASAVDGLWLINKLLIINLLAECDSWVTLGVLKLLTGHHLWVEWVSYPQAVKLRC